ncbi:MAG: M43 family zinc metalloprotease [Saprospiraceae bacterium]
MNESFSAMNADISFTPEFFQDELAGNTGIQFCLAIVDTNGISMSEPGIQRINWSDHGWTDPSSFGPGNVTTNLQNLKNYFNNVVKPASIWDAHHYLNIWVADFSNTISGWATWPAGYSSNGIDPSEIETGFTSGLLLNHVVCGNIGTADNPPVPHQHYDGGRTAVHELGHWLGLLHLWSGSLESCFGGDCGNDYCDDTPGQFHEHYGCFEAPLEGLCCPLYFNNPFHGVMFMNYMDYTNDSCRVMFTQDQADRMHTAMISGEFRSSMQYSTACQSPCTDLIVKDQSTSQSYCHAGDSITLHFKEKNIGGITAGPNYVSFHLSSNDVLTPGQQGDVYIDEYLVNQSILPLTQTNELTKVIDIPPSTNPGTYYLFFSADGAQEITECNELNNFATVIITVSDSIGNTQSGYRYWFDNQFQQAISVNQPIGNIFLLEDSIATTSLSPGLHEVNIAFKNTYDLWSSTISSMFFKLSSSFPSGSARYDYWFDNNFNTRIVKTINSTSNLFLIKALNTGSLTNGLHSFSIRLKPDGRNWTSTISSLFYKLDSPFPAGPPQYEFWFDNNYSGRVIDSIAGTNNLIILDSILTIGLSQGLHTFHVRSKPDGLHWSSTTSDLFYKTKPSGGDIIKYQYWFDTQFQDTVTVSVPPTDNLQVTALINSMNIATGLHSFHIRHNQSDGLWSSVTSDLFYKNDPDIPNNRIVKFVYWYDHQWQNAQTLYLPGLPNDSLTVYLNAEDLAVGDHPISMYFGDVGDKRSSIIIDTFTKVESPIVCPFNNKYFTSGINHPQSATLQWQVNTGSGYINVINDAVYSGATTDTLHLTNAPTSWYGNLYRCQITDNNGTVSSQTYTLKFSLTWNGSVSTAWENASNWSCTTLPDAYTDVYINTGASNYPEVNVTTSCRTLKLKPGAAVIVKSGNMLNVTGND